MKRAFHGAMTCLALSFASPTLAGPLDAISGGDDSVTRYFGSKTEGALTEKFLPIVSTATARVGLAEQYNSLASQGQAFGLVREQDANIESYVTRKAMDGLFAVIAEQEKALRANPMGASSDLVKKVFGALR